MRRTRSFRDRLALSCIVACLGLLAPVAPGLLTRAHGQMPGPETFVKEPETPLELWEMVDYLVRTGQVRQAVPYLDRFMKSELDDATLLQIRDRYGVGSVLRLDDYPETKPLAGPLHAKLAAASKRSATRAERIEKFVRALTLSSEEQQYAVERLREAGPYAVPFLIQALDWPNRTHEERARIAYNMGRLDHAAVPPLIAALDSSDQRIAADAARALGAIGDPRAVPQLTYVAAPAAPSPARDAARRAIAQLTGRPFEGQRLSPIRLLTAEARRYHLHKVRFPGDTILIWEWDEAQKIPVPREVSRSEAEAFFGMRLAHEALKLDPTDLPAQEVLTSLALEKAVEREGFARFLAGDPTGAYTAALTAGPAVLGPVLRTAITDGKMDLAAAAATALGQVADREIHAPDRRVNPLVEALTAPGRRVQFAAARALVLLDPRRPFPGSSLVVPTLARFVSAQPAPRAVVIDGNPARGGQVAGFLRTIGYDPVLEPTGRDGFVAAAESADVELITIDTHLTEGTWPLVDTIANLRADARTAGIPIYVIGMLNQDLELAPTFNSYPGIRFVVLPTSAELLEAQLGNRPVSLTEAERTAYATEAASLLATVASRPGNPFESDLKRAEEALTIGLGMPATRLNASAALGDVPDPNAQRGLADVVLDPSKPAPLRLSAAGQLARSLQRFGPLVAADQEAKLVAAYRQASDPTLQSALAAVLGALRPKAAQSGQRLEEFRVLPVPPGEQATPAPPAAAPSPPPPPEAAPPAANPPAEAVPAPAEAKP